MDDQIPSALSQVARLMRRDFDARARSIGVTRPQWQVLALVNRNEGINQGGLAELIEVEPITVARMVDRLQDSGLIERRNDPADRRAWKLFLTDRGRSLLRQLQPHGAATAQQMLEGFTTEERAQFSDMLERMRANLSRQPTEGTIGG